MSKTPRRLLTFLVVIAAIALLGWYYTRPRALRVIVHAAARGTVAATVANTRAGTVHAHRRARLSPPVGGQVAALPVTEGDRVEEGQLLLELWNEDLRAELELAEHEARRAEALAEEADVRAKFAGREAVRQKELADANISSAERVDRAVADADAARAAHRAAVAQTQVQQARIATIRAALGKTILQAPFAGVVAEVNGELGEIVTPSPVGIPTPPAVDLIDASTLYVSAPIDEVDAAAVRPGMTAKITLDAFPGRGFTGRVRRVAPYVLDLEKQARTVAVEVDFVAPPEDAHLLPGYSADAEIVLETRPDVLRVPTVAVLDGDRVLVLDEDRGELVERGLEAGLRNWEFTEVLAGLAAGELVVTSLDRAGVAAGAAAVRDEAVRR